MFAAGSDTIPTAVVKMLLAKGADANAKELEGETAQMLALKRGDTEVARLLGAPAKASNAMKVVPVAESGRPERSIAEAV